MSSNFKDKETYLNRCIELINLLIESKQKTIKELRENNNNKDAQVNSFKVRSYYKWLVKLDELKVNDDYDIDNFTLAYMKKFKITTGLQSKMTEIFKTNSLTDLSENSNSSCNSSTGNSGSNGNSSSNGNINSNTNGHNIQPSAYDSSNSNNENKCLTGLPKQLNNVSRPKDKRGSIIYDLRIVTGIGPKFAEKFADSGITLELLLLEWNDLVKEDSSNSTLMTSKLPIPSSYTKSDWDSLSEEKQHSIQIQNIQNKFQANSKYLCSLNHHQLLGIKYFYDILKRIPREEIISTEKFLNTIAKHINKKLVVKICGSYRRGREHSGDIDTLITHPDIKTKEDLDNCDINILQIFVKQLEIINYIIDHLTLFSKTKYMGISMHPKKKIARRIDIKFVPYNSFGSAILYFTGSKNFNEKMRGDAKRKGYTLNEYGLYKIANGKKNLISCFNEKDIFDELNMEYVEPTKRDI